MKRIHKAGGIEYRHATSHAGKWLHNLDKPSEVFPGGKTRWRTRGDLKRIGEPPVTWPSPSNPGTFTHSRM